MTLTVDHNTAPTGAYTELDQLLALRFAARELQLTPKRLSTSLLSGPVRTRFRGRGMEFEEVRHYQPGDDIRTIDWHVTARTQVTHTKLFREERERPVILMVDQRASMYFGSRYCFKSVMACHLAALMGWAALANNDRVGALVFSDTQEKDSRPKRSRHTLLNILKDLHEYNQQLQSPVSPATKVDLSQRLSDLRRIARPGSAVVIISDFHDMNDDCEEQLYQLAAHVDLSLLHVSDPLEKALPGNLRLTVSDGTQRRLLDTRSKDFQRDYKRSQRRHLQHLKTSANRLALPLLDISTDQSAISQLLPVFGKNAYRR